VLTHTRSIEFELQNVGVGPDPLSVATVAESADFALVVFLAEPPSVECQLHLDAIASRRAEFRERDVAIVPVMPAPTDAAREWYEHHEPPLPLLADPSAGTRGATGNGSTGSAFGTLGTLDADVLDADGTPDAAVVDTRLTAPRVATTVTTPGTRPTVDDLLAAVERQRDQFVFDRAVQ
jgi:peroxiredoxin Q/BCP